MTSTTGNAAAVLSLLVASCHGAIPTDRAITSRNHDPSQAPAAPSGPPAADKSDSSPSQDSGSAYLIARRRFQTRLVRKGASPQPYEPLQVPADVVEVSYDSGNLKLKAWLSPATSQNQHASAVLFLHGGFAFAADDWAMTRPYRDAGFVVLVPMLRGENGLPGDYSFFFDEVDDVLAAADALSRVPYVRADHIYIAGHSAGGTLAMLASMASNRFRAAASFSGSPDQVLFARGWPQLVPFDPTDASELLIRSPIEYPTSFQCPARLYFGSQERAFATSTTRLAERAQAATLDVVARSVAGDHFSAVAEEMALSIAFFREKD